MRASLPPMAQKARSWMGHPTIRFGYRVLPDHLFSGQSFTESFVRGQVLPRSFASGTEFYPITCFQDRVLPNHLFGPKFYPDQLFRVQSFTNALLNAARRWLLFFVGLCRWLCGRGCRTRSEGVNRFRLLRGARRAAVAQVFDLLRTKRAAGVVGLDRALLLLERRLSSVREQSC